MPSFRSIPQARMFRKAGQLMSPPRLPRGASIGEHLRTLVACALELWSTIWILVVIAAALFLAFASIWWIPSDDSCCMYTPFP